MLFLRDRSLLMQRQIAELFKISYPAVSLSIKRLEGKIQKEPELKELIEKLDEGLDLKLIVKT